MAGSTSYLELAFQHPPNLRSDKLASPPENPWLHTTRFIPGKPRGYIRDELTTALTAHSILDTPLPPELSIRNFEPLNANKTQAVKNKIETHYPWNVATSPLFNPPPIPISTDLSNLIINATKKQMASEPLLALGSLALKIDLLP